MLLELKQTAVHYRKVEAIRDISIQVPEGNIVTLIGANGAGKSTTLRMISGLVRPSSGEVLFEGNSIVELPPEEITGMGIAHIPEGRRVFPQMTVRENLALGAYLRMDPVEIARNLELVFFPFPSIERKGQSSRGDHERR